MLLVAMLYGCAAERLNREGLKQIEQGNFEEGVAKLDQAAKSDTSDLHYRAQSIRKREESINFLLNQAAEERAVGHLDTAEKLYRRVLAIEAGNKRAQNGIDELSKDRRHQTLLEEARVLLKTNEFDEALSKLQPALIENPANTEVLALKREIEAQQSREGLAVPTLKSLYKKPITLEFRDANLKMVFEVLSHTSGINFILDKDVRPDLTTTIFVKKSSLENVLDLMLTTSKLEKKVLDSNTVLIYPNTPDKVREYQELMVKSFYIENADVKQTMSMVKMLLKTREIYVDEKLNMMVMRDTPETIRLAEKLIAMQDLAEPEVMLEVEVLEVKRSRLLDLGIKYPEQLTLAPIAGAGGGALTLRDLKSINSSRISASVTNTVINAKKDDTDINLLANPRIRTRNREQAKIMIGDRVPVITTTSTATGFVSDSVQYVDVGLKLDVQPTIYLHDDVAIKVSLEVSSIVNQITSKNGTLTYQIGSRTASTVLRLKDGETQVLAGLINNEDRKTANKLPGLGDLPVLGRLFSTHRDDNQKTEIVLSITPHLIRNLKRPDAQASEFWSGSETILRTTPLLLHKTKSNEQDFDKPKSSIPNATGQPSTDEVKSDEGKDAEVSASVAPTHIGLSWQGPRQVKAGEQFKVTLILKTDGGLRSLPFQLAYDAAALKVVEVAEGGFFKQNAAQTSFTSNVDIAGGKIFVGVVRPGAVGAAGEDSLTTVTFKALTAQAKSEVKLLAATPVGLGDKLPNPELPDAYSVSISD
ncbi:MAG: cohesin domain-containing protein [Gallionella sp.]|nr:cohesin domain-containing protein [Gallionella sp.]